MTQERMADKFQHHEGGATETCQAHNQNQMSVKETTHRMMSRLAGLEPKKRLKRLCVTSQ